MPLHEATVGQPPRKPTRSEFGKYVSVQRQGRYNMLDPRARLLTGLSKEIYSYIISHYEELEREYSP